MSVSSKGATSWSTGVAQMYRVLARLWSPHQKKTLAARHWLLAHNSANVCAIADLPAPTPPLSHRIGGPVSFAHRMIASNSPTRVPGGGG